MNDPHIDSLKYRVESIGLHIFDYEATEPFSSEVDCIGEFRIVDNELTVVLAMHCPDEQAARHVVEPFLRAWEIHTDLTSRHGAIRFGFTSSTCHDLNPPDGLANYGLSDHLTVTDSFEFRVKMLKYPEPPPKRVIAFDDLLRDIHARWCQYQEGKEPLPGMANYVLTRIELEAPRGPNGKRSLQEAARHFNISEKVLNQIGEISALPGIGLTLRKAYGQAGSTYFSSTADEDEVQNIQAQLQEWLGDSISKVILHLSCQSQAPTAQLTMGDLKTLPPRVR